MLTASDTGAGDRFGHSVFVQGDTVMVGAPGGAFAEFNCCGAAYVFRFDGTSWVETQRLTASDEVTRGSFGHSVFISGDTAVIGAAHANGKAYVFSFDGAFWSEDERLTASDAVYGDSFGTSVSVSGNTVVVGAPAADCAAGERCGSAYVYTCTPPRAVDLDIRPGSCPNRVNPRRSGAVPIAIVGSSSFDVATVDLGSLTLARADGVGESVSPRSGLLRRGDTGIVIKDVATPYVGVPCACHTMGGDGIDDVLLQFSIADLRQELQLNSLPRGATVELVLQGTLQDGSTFEGRDCMVIWSRVRYFRK